MPVRDPDVPVASGILGRLHTFLGRSAIGIKVRFQRPMTMGVRLIALNADGDILLVRHSYLPGYALPGGGVDPGETTCQAAMREAREEAGLEFPEPPKLFHLYLNKALADRDHVALFVARHVRQPVEYAANAEILSARFYPLTDLPDETTPGTRARIAEALGGVSPSDYW